jgi:hypothetical protein
MATFGNPLIYLFIFVQFVVDKKFVIFWAKKLGIFLDTFVFFLV